MNWPLHFQIIWKYFYSTKSGRDRGTLYNVWNSLNCTNVPINVKRDFNACEDFTEMFTSSQTSAVALMLFGMKSLDDTPDTSILPESMWMGSKEKRKEFLIKQCQKLYDTFVSLSIESSSNAYAHTAKDGVSSYAIQFLRIGALYIEFADGTGEGDGERALRYWWNFLPMFRASHSTNYHCKAVRLLHGQPYALFPGFQTKWNEGFANVHGLPGRNIPLDLHMEHLNCLAKGAMKNLGSNKSTTKINNQSWSILRNPSPNCWGVWFRKLCSVWLQQAHVISCAWCQHGCGEFNGITSFHCLCWKIDNVQEI